MVNGRPIGPSAPRDGTPPDDASVRWDVLLDRSLAELQARVEQQRQVIRALAGREATPVACACPLIDCARINRLRAAISEAVEVLEVTRRSFKSRQLESLRKTLAEVLSNS